MAGSDLSPEARVVIVSMLACYYSNSEVRQIMEEEYGVEVDAMTVSRHNPNNKSSEGVLRQDLIDLFWQKRDEFERSLGDCGIVWKAYRLKRLDDMVRKAIKANNFPLAAQLLEQGAKEVGGVYEPRRRDGAITLETLQSVIDKLAAVVVREVKDPDILSKIDEGWGEAGIGGEKGAARSERPEWS